jgi:uncharacterized membrane protein (DUF2068 family)
MEVACDRRVYLRRYVIATWKFFFGALDFFVGSALLFFSEARLERWAQQLVATELKEDSGDRLALFLDQWLPALIDRKMSIALVLLAWGTASMIAAIGFMRGKPWGYYSILALVGAFMVFDVPSFIVKPSLTAAVTVTINVVVLWFLVKYRHAFLEC